LYADGYDYHPADQPYTIEVWIEKSTMNDVLVPLCEELGVNLVVGKGFTSITRAVELLERTVKPVRIFYISDFDSKGKHMPMATARHIEFWGNLYDCEVKLTPLVLTSEQIATYDLPRNFIDGQGNATELDALEVAYPGELARIVRDAVSTYRDDTLPWRLRQAKNVADIQVNTQWREVTKQARERLAEVEGHIAKITETYAKQLEKDLAPFASELESLRVALTNAAERFKPTLPPRPVPQVSPPSEHGWLLDTTRDYEHQLMTYKEREQRIKQELLKDYKEQQL
jgi:hypothetical protein